MIEHSGKWIQQIAGLQHDDGSWGFFHSLSQPTKTQPMTTEQALRRLRVLGLSKDDVPIKRALQYMRDCLNNKTQPPDRREKVLNWDAFQAHMMAAWIRIFEPDDSLASPVSIMWAGIIKQSFKSGSFDEEIYASEYRKRIPVLHKGERLIVPSQFYMVNLLCGMLDETTENAFVDYIINYPTGIFYVNNSRIAELPAVFASREASQYLAALEQIVGYSCAGRKMVFAKQWILSQKDEYGEWDMGASVKDGIYFPISDSWRNPKDRKNDCTSRITKLLKAME